MLNFLGNGSAFNRERDDTSAYFIKGKTLFLIDCGSTTFKNALRKNIFDGIEQVSIIISHLHMDHCGSLSQMIMYLLYKRKITPCIVCPDENLKTLMRITGVSDDMYIYLSKKVNALAEGVNVLFVESAHVNSINCYGIEISMNDNIAIYYSGDSGAIPSDILEKYLNGVYSKLYQDTCGERIDGTVHLNIEDLCNLIPQGKRKRIYCMHLDPLLSEEDVKKHGFKVARVV